MPRTYEKGARVLVASDSAVQASSVVDSFDSVPDP